MTAHGCCIPASTARFRTPVDITAFLAHTADDPNRKIKQAY
jgi:hypothetical protein